MHSNQTLATTSDDFYIEASLPAGLTIAEYRLTRPPRPSAWRRVTRLAGYGRGPAHAAR